jgi:hypothetical protein
VGEPVAGLLGGFPVRFEVLLDKGACDRVGNCGGECRVGRLVEDFDQASLTLGIDFQVLGNLAEKRVLCVVWFWLREAKSFAPGGKAAVLPSAE